MILRILLGICLAIGLAGCATMKKDVVTTDQLQMQISDLEKQIQEKDSQIQVLEDQVSGIRRVQAEKVQKKAAGKATTLEVQKALKNAGYYKGNVDGKVGQLTKSAVKAFQKDNGLKEDGVVGQQTWAKLSTYLEE